MDRELASFRKKLVAMGNPTALLWLLIVVVKVSYRKFQGKLFRKGSVAYSGGQLVSTKGESISFVKLTHLRSASELPFSEGTNWSKPAEKVIWQSGYSDVQDLHLLHRFGDMLMSLLCATDGEVRKEMQLLAVRRMLDWIESNPVGSQPGWHPYTTSERLVTWIWILNLLEEKNLLADGVELDVVHASILSQASYLSRNIEYDLGHHNHLINNARALMTVALSYPGSSPSTEWVRLAVAIMKEEWPHQILPDGVHSEQSVVYHFLLARTLWEFKWLYKQAGIDFPYEKDLVKMQIYAATMRRPDGSIPFIGHITPDWHWAELVGLLPLWGYTEAEHSVLSHVYSVEEGQSRSIDAGKYLFPYAGLAVLKDSAYHVVLASDPRGRVTVHGDQNQLGVDVWIKGTHLIRDAGLDSYNLDENRFWFESAEGQSTFTIDCLEPVVSNWRRRQLPGAYCESGGTISIDESGVVYASHTGFLRLPDPVQVSRSVQVLDGSVLAIVDEAKGRLSHSYMAHFHLGSVSVEEVKDNSMILVDQSNGQRFLFVWPKGMTIELLKRPYAKAYGSKSEGSTVRIASGFSGELRIDYKITPL